MTRVQTIERVPATHELPETVSVLREDGSADPSLDPGLSVEAVVALYEAMRQARVIDERVGALDDAGRVGFLPTAVGREAAIVGATAALSADDWIFPTGSDWAAALTRGQALSTFAHRLNADARDPLKGHDMPAGLSSKAEHVASASAPAGTHLPHAVGVAWAAARAGDERIAAAFFDASEVDAADFHTGLNFAGVWKVPVLFVCRVPHGEAGAAEHAVAYGLDAVRCDGDDPLAVFRTVRAAAAARTPKVIDLLLGADPDAPLARTRAHLEGLGAWDEAREQGLIARTEESLAIALEAASRTESLPLASIFDGVFEALPPHLIRQRDSLLAGPRSR